MQVIMDRCEAAHVAPDVDKGRSTITSITDDGRFRVTLETAAARYENILIGLRGRHQITNASVAIRLAEALRKQGFQISPDAIVQGIQTARHAGRLELFPGQPSVLLDGAHNPSGAQALRDFLIEFVKPPITLVFGAMNDKRLAEIAEILFRLADIVILTQPDNPRAARVETLSELATPLIARDQIIASGSVSEAMDLARNLAEAKGTICVTGSLYLVGEALANINAAAPAEVHR